MVKRPIFLVKAKPLNREQNRIMKREFEKVNSFIREMCFRHKIIATEAKDELKNFDDFFRNKCRYGFSNHKFIIPNIDLFDNKTEKRVIEKQIESHKPQLKRAQIISILVLSLVSVLILASIVYSFLK